MKSLFFPNFFLRFALLGVLASGLLSAVAQGQTAPVINSPASVSGAVGQPFSYEITTVDDNALVYGNETLPAGFSRSSGSAIITGIPQTAGVFSFTVSASNAFGTGSQLVTLTISAAVPVFTSANTVEARVGNPLSFTVTATNSPDTFQAIGLDGVGGVTIDNNTGVISGTPLNAGTHDVVIIASNGSGQATQILQFEVAPSLVGAGAPLVNILSPTGGALFSGDTASIDVIAEVTPTGGGTLDTVFARWNNPPASSGISSVTLIELTAGAIDPVSGAITYTGTIPVGFNPNDRQLGGGSINLEIVAFQTTATGLADFGRDTVIFRISPILQILFPTPNLVFDSIKTGDIFASVRLSTNDFSEIKALVLGPGIAEEVTDSNNADNQNGIHNFVAVGSVELEAVYTLRITATDNSGTTTTRELEFLVSDTLGEPVAVVTSPTPGFTNEVFSAGLLEYAAVSRSFITVNGVPDPVAVSVEYVLTLIEGGQGYFPRNGTDLAIPFSSINPDGDRVVITIPGVTVENGRITEIPDTITVEFPRDPAVPGRFIGEPISANSAVIDNLFLPGNEGRIRIAASFFKAGADLDTFRIVVNGEDVTPGAGNYDPIDDLTGAPLSVDVPVVRYPLTTAPPPGDYVVFAEVTDKQGEVGTSEPIAFKILPFEPLAIQLSREGIGEVEQGSEVDFVVDVAPINIVQTVEFFDSSSGESLGLASKTTVDGEERFRFSRLLNQQGIVSVFAVATANNGQTARSSQIEITVTQINDLSVSITSPNANRALFKGQSLTFAANADATPGVESVVWVVNNVVEETDTTEPYEFARLFDTVGNFRVLARATDNFGNIVDSSAVTVTVSNSDVSVAISSPLGDQLVVQGESLTFSGSASSSLGVDRVDWIVDGDIVETDTASPYSLTFSFGEVGVSSVSARATDSLGNTASSASITVQVNSPNPLLRDEDFVADIYASLIGSSPTNDQRAAALAALDGTLTSRSQFVADLLQSDALQTTSIVQLIYRTMTGEWPDANALEAGRDVLTNGGTGVVDANALTVSLIPEYESRFAVLNTRNGFVQQLFRNKHGTQPNAQSQVRLYNAATGASVSLSNGQVIPGYGGDLVSYATQFALDNDLSNFNGPDGLPLSSLHLYSYPNNPEADSLLASLISALWGIEPIDSEINALSGLSLTGAVETVLTDSRYYSQFPSTSPDGGIAQIMATFGVFDLSKNGPDDDADGDGATNLEEIALGSDPSDAADTVEPMTASIDGTDFVVTFIKLADPSTLGGLDYTIQCSPTMADGSWMDADPSATQNLAADQSGVPTGYERIEFRIDMTTQDCTFVRVVVD